MIFKEYKYIWQIEKHWKRIMPPDTKKIYQLYDFNKLFYIYRKTSLSNIKKGNTACRFVVGFENNKAVCIAPLTIDTYKEKTIRLLGYGTNAGYLDYIYTDERYVSELHRYIMEKYQEYSFDYIFVPEVSPLTKIMTSCELFNNYMITTNGYEAYYNSLSKNTRQNVRTAYNRLTKDSCEWELKCYSGRREITAELLQQINDVYHKRKADWKDLEAVSEKEKRVFLHRDTVYQGAKKLDCSEISVLYINGKVAAFMIAFSYTNGVCIPRLAIDTEYSRYSPGVILINEYLKNHSNIENYQFDLCRGDEKYKSSLGGSSSLTYRLC